MNWRKKSKYKEFLVLLLRGGQRYITICPKNDRIIANYFGLKNKNTVATYLREMESLGFVDYDIRKNWFVINTKLDEKTRISEFSDK